MKGSAWCLAQDKPFIKVVLTIIPKEMLGEIKGLFYNSQGHHVI